PFADEGRWLFRKQIGIGRNLIVAGIAAPDVGVNGKVSAAGIEQDRAFAAAIDGGDRATALQREAASRDRGRDAVVLRIDHAADRLRAVTQCRRAADDLDGLRRQRIDWYAVIFAKLRNAA